MRESPLLKFVVGFIVLEIPMIAHLKNTACRLQMQETWKHCHENGISRLLHILLGFIHCIDINDMSETPSILLKE